MAEDSDRQNFAIRFATIDSRYRTFRTGIRTVGWVAVAYFCYKSIGALAGQTTSVSVLVNIILNALFDLKFAMSITLAGACAVWATAERMLRHRVVGQLGARNAELERSLDLNRTTSGLTVNGKTHPQDR
jgi:hypothetical protein